MAVKVDSIQGGLYIVSQPAVIGINAVAKFIVSEWGLVDSDIGLSTLCRGVNYIPAVRNYEFGY